MKSVLVLNADFSPLTICSVEKGFLLVYLNKADVISEVSNKSLRSITTSFPFPSVIRIKKYANVPYKGVILTRQNIFKRDNHSCQYCGAGADLTLDHLIPKSKGGKSTWTNLVTACKRCNARKGDFYLNETEMILRSKPIRPTYVMFLKATSKTLRTDWLPYLERKASA